MLIVQSCPTLCDPVDCSSPGSSVHGISQATILEWVAIPFSRDLPDPGIEPGLPTVQADSFLSEPPQDFGICEGYLGGMSDLRNKTGRGATYPNRKYRKKGKFRGKLTVPWASLVAQRLKRLPAVQETWV